MEANFKAGDVLTAEMLNALVRDHAIDVRGGGGVSVRSSGGRSLQIATHFTGAFTGKASGAISARASATLGTGNVELYIKDPSTGGYIDTGILLAVDNLSSTTGGIPDTTWVAGFFQDDGTPLVMTADCGN
jgi:hypothetical protein